MRKKFFKTVPFSQLPKDHMGTSSLIYIYREALKIIIFAATYLARLV